MKIGINEGNIISSESNIHTSYIKSEIISKGITYNLIKRVLDIIGALLGIIILIPLVVFVYVLRVVLKENNTPLFYEQIRIGKNGKIFKIYKFRSMCIQADEKLEKYLQENEEAREEYQKYKKLKNDPRITKVGKIIRKNSIDEFPQFINVLKGDMSLVGPRPYLPKEKEDMNGFFEYIISCKPGLTGLWQARGRSKSTFEQRLKKDMNYYYNRSLILDVKLIFLTIKQIIKKEGAV